LAAPMTHRTFKFSPSSPGSSARAENKEPKLPLPHEIVNKIETIL